MHHNVKALVRAVSSGLPFTYNVVSSGVAAAMRAVTASRRAMATVMSLSSRSSASLLFSVRTIWGTSTALKMPPETSVNMTCGIMAPA